MIDKTISHYHVTEELGRGGMGVVYKATDTELNRTVALKFLPSHVISSEKDRERFRREAQAAAALSHPNIATVYAIEESDSESFIAMEYVDGQTLQEVIAESPMKIDRAIEVATQIAHGLQAAHEQGVVHRDIKPSNIMLTSRGHVKIMDFGLAKISAASLLTQTGSTLGTAGYMSPEQARGDEVDRRSDVWGLGVVLYEMITGSLPFGGEYEQALVYSILNADPEPLTARRSGVPIALDGVIAKALAKDPDMRYQHVDEIPADLKAVQAGVSSMTSRIGPAMSGIQATTSSATAMGSGVQSAAQKSIAVEKSSIPAVIPWVVAGVAVVAALYFGFFTSPPEFVEPVRRITIPLAPASGSFQFEQISLSEDGRAFSFEVPGPDGSETFVRFFDQSASRKLVSAAGFNASSLSPDARWLAFREDGSLLRVSTDGGSPETLADDLGRMIDVRWMSRTEVLTYRATADTGLEFLAVRGSDVTAYPTPSDLNDRTRADHLDYIRESNLVLYSRYDEAGFTRVVAHDLENGHEVEIASGATTGRFYKDGYVLFQRSGDLHAIPFDPQTLETGSSFLLLPEVATLFNGQLVLYDVAQNGTLIYLPAHELGEAEGSSLTTGSSIELLSHEGSKTGALHDPRFSPDGSKILVHSRDEENDIWLIDRTRGGATQRMTETEGEDETPFWDPDSEHFYYVGNGGDGKDIIFRSNVNDPTDRDSLTTIDGHVHIESVSRDGRELFFMVRQDGRADDIWVLDIQSPSDARPIINNPARELSGRISPDGKWIAYVSDETTQSEIYLQNYPELNRRVVLTSDGALSPVWSADGRYLYFVSGTRLLRMPFDNGQTGPEEEVGELPKSLVETNNHTEYDVFGNGDEFVFIDSGRSVNAEEISMYAITGLSELLRQRDPERVSE